MKFKKIEVGILVLTLILILSCSSVFADTERFSLATGGLAGTYYPIGAAIASIIDKFVPGVELNVESTGASVANLNMLREGDVDFIMGAANTQYSAYYGEAPFDKDKVVKNVRGITSLFPETIHLMTRKGSGIKSLYDIKGKRIVVGAPGSGTERTVKLLLSMYGITYDDIEEQFLAVSQGVAALKDRNLDGVFIMAGFPISAVIDAAVSMELYLVPLDKKVCEKFLEEIPFLQTSIIPAGLYEGVNEDVFSIASPALLSVAEDVSEEIVYKITKAIFEHLDILWAAHNQAKNIKLENATRAMSIPLHPGAEKYYKEVGLLK